MVSNGAIPLTLLRQVDGTHYASPGCARAWHGFAGELGLTVHNEADSAYRSLAWQQYRWNLHASNPRLYPVAAKPGHSNHGLGQAIDIGNYYRFAHKDLVRVGKKYNFKFDTSSEAWHVVYLGAPDYSATASNGTVTPISRTIGTRMFFILNPTTKKYWVIDFITPAHEWKGDTPQASAIVGANGSKTIGFPLAGNGAPAATQFASFVNSYNGSLYKP